ncbi:hypothetical protein LZ30DRAFT_472591 [Colletotrichum cereale]|nr:hypothetical protein LZ30DRAFT_472591 [Colletotrichum cereale]
MPSNPRNPIPNDHSARSSAAPYTPRLSTEKPTTAVPKPRLREPCRPGRQFRVTRGPVSSLSPSLSSAPHRQTLTVQVKPPHLPTHPSPQRGNPSSRLAYSYPSSRAAGTSQSATYVIAGYQPVETETLSCFLRLNPPPPLMGWWLSSETQT